VGGGAAINDAVGTS